MFNFKEILQQEFEQLRADLVKRYKDKGMFASGEFEREAEVIASDQRAQIWGINYTEQLEYGRRPSLLMPPRSAIEDWIEDKGVFAAAINEIGIKSLAFLIARKIQQKGYDRAKYGGVNLVSEVVTPERIQSIINKCGEVAVAEFVSSLNLDDFNI